MSDSTPPPLDHACFLATREADRWPHAESVQLILHADPVRVAIHATILVPGGTTTVADLQAIPPGDLHDRLDFELRRLVDRGACAPVEVAMLRAGVHLDAAIEACGRKAGRR